MAGLIAGLFGGKSSVSHPPVETDIGGYQSGPGPTGEYGYPGTTALTRTNRGLSPRAAKLDADTNSGFEQALSTQDQTRQAANKWGQRNPRNPRQTETVSTPQPLMTVLLQQTPATNLGGMLDKTGPGNHTAGGNPGTPSQRAGGHNVRDTTTPWTKAQPNISGGVPGAQNVRNQIAQDYKARPELLHTYKSAPRPDQAPVNTPGGQATDGNVHPDRVVTDVTVPSRYVYNGGQNQTWSVLREMPYGGRGNGARGADLNGQRYYATGQEDQFWNAGQGDYGLSRKQGGKRPVSFDQPAPWTSNFYDTTSQVADDTSTQAPDMVYTSPSYSRGMNTATRG